MDPYLGAGDFSAWMAEMSETIRGDRSCTVPCDGCVACCISSLFIHVGPDETETLSRIPRELLFPAPRLPRGHVVLGYDDQCRCPMLANDRCTIYEHRPKTCCTFDCRVFTAAGLAGDCEQTLIARQVRRWQFTFPSEADRIRRAAVQRAAAFLDEQSCRLAPGFAPTSTMQLAVRAIQIHEVFLQRDARTGRTTIVEPDLDAVRDEILRRTTPGRSDGRSSETGRGAGPEAV